jgi:predicted KAP-like P-loop ATPase
MPRPRKVRILRICNLHLFEGLKRLQPIENSVVSIARCSPLARHGVDPCNRLPFHLQIYFCEPIRCGQAAMTQRVADGQQIHARLQKRNGRAAQAMGIKPLLAEIGNLLGSTVKALRQDATDPESGQRCATAISRYVSL